MWFISVWLRWWSAARSGQAKPKQPSQAAIGKLLSAQPHVMSEKAQSALRKEQGWTHWLRCFQRLATQVCMKKYVSRTSLVLISNNYNSWVWMYVANPIFFIRRLKRNHRTHQCICVYSWDRHHHEHIAGTHNIPAVLMTLSLWFWKMTDTALCGW